MIVVKNSSPVRIRNVFPILSVAMAIMTVLTCRMKSTVKKVRKFKMIDCVVYTIIKIFVKKRLKIPKGQSEAVNRRKTDNTMVKRKRTNNDLQNTTQKTKD